MTSARIGRYSTVRPHVSMRTRSLAVATSVSRYRCITAYIVCSSPGIAGNCFGAGDRLPVGAAGVEVECVLGRDGRSGAHAERQRDEDRAHGPVGDEVRITAGARPAVPDRKKRTRMAWGRKAGPSHRGNGAFAR